MKAVLLALVMVAAVVMVAAAGCGSVETTSALVTPDGAADLVDQADGSHPDAGDEVTPPSTTPDASTDADCSRQCRVPEGVTCCLCKTSAGEDTCCSNLGFAGECCGAGC